MIYTYGIKHLAVRGLDSASFLQLMIESREAIASFIKEYKVEAVYSKKLEEFSTVLDTFQKVSLIKTSSKTAQSLETADRARDATVLTLSNLIRAFSRVTEPATKSAYDTLSTVFKEYKVSVTDSYEKESVKITQLLKVLARKDCQQALSSLYLTTYLEQLVAAQATFDRIYKLHLEEEKGQMPSQVKILRAQLFELYNFFVDFTAIMTSAYPDRRELSDLLKELNVIRQRYTKRKSLQVGEEEKIPALDV
ncbi:DUF6261 family protein [Streptococcus respiraculi]|uniref:DUF6261 family protein n=1 Tax=Streptococcus respiraculi TaxID=2021971 RepID=UPI000E754F0B|nr:DUF6261 family protein [Streptococcus respiraculi]